MPTVLQFGGGVFLRGFADVFIDESNSVQPDSARQRVVVVERNRSETAQILASQRFRYTVVTQGVRAGEVVRETRIITCIEDVLSSAYQWGNVLECALDTDLQVILSNTTETGITYDEADTLGTATEAPRSFPCKILVCLYARWKAACGGVLVLPTELIERNGYVLHDYVVRHATRFGLEPEFLAWMEREVMFCTTLVDRIVPGQLNAGELHDLKLETGFDDAIAIAAEPYRFFAIEVPEARIEAVRELVRQRVRWLNHPAIAITSDITKYRERKLRLLNGGHTASAILGLMLGCATVRELMTHPVGTEFVARALLDEIVPTLPYDQDEMRAFAGDVLDRFRNPFLHHSLKTIATNSSTKMAVRVMPTIVRYYEQFGTLPECLTRGFAVFVAVFLRVPTSTVVPTWSDDNEESMVALLDESHIAHNVRALRGAQSGAVTHNYTQEQYRAAVQTMLQHPLWEPLQSMAGSTPERQKIVELLAQQCWRWV
jgi:tagaturonate reductase